jgi:molybdopterin/thiamine biosynthesis adenylyltransferase
MERYLRHIILPNIGLGALGIFVSVYLEVVGIGYLKLVNFDVISILHRQVFYKPSDINKPKTETSKKYINDFNPEVKIEVTNEALGYDNFEKIVKDIDIIIDIIVDGQIELVKNFY